MTLIASSPKRSYIMSRIRSRDTQPELLLRRALWAKGIRYRLHGKKLPGKPDIVIKKYKLAIFVDGEFWHGYQWHETKNRLNHNREFWIAKIERNIARDRENNKALNALGYTVIRFWAADVQKHLDKCVNLIQLYLETARDGEVPYPAEY